MIVIVADTGPTEIMNISVVSTKLSLTILNMMVSLCAVLEKVMLAVSCTKSAPKEWKKIVELSYSQLYMHASGSDHLPVADPSMNVTGRLKRDVSLEANVAGNWIVSPSLKTPLEMVSAVQNKLCPYTQTTIDGKKIDTSKGKKICPFSSVPNLTSTVTAIWG